MKDVEVLASILAGRGEEMYNRIKLIERELEEIELLVDRLLESS
ncbi:MAG: hypothetical protein QXP98_06115 [Thermoproteus sp.]